MLLKPQLNSTAEQVGNKVGAAQFALVVQTHAEFLREADAQSGPGQDSILADLGPLHGKAIARPETRLEGTALIIIFILPSETHHRIQAGRPPFPPSVR